MLDLIINYFNRKQTPETIDVLLFSSLFTTILALIFVRFSKNLKYTNITPVLFIYPVIIIIFLLLKILNLYNIETLQYNTFINYFAIGFIGAYIIKLNRD
jgi:RsiW-degrading membrane proteinase PrsW (M82 family)